MKLYTRTGDDGTTGLIGGSRLSKADLRVECYGTVDELNAAVGMAVAELAVTGTSDFQHPTANSQLATSHSQLPTGNLQLATAHSLRTRLLRVQNELFVVGSHLAVVEAAYAAALPPIDSPMIERLEAEIDQAEEALAPLRNFILPGGTKSAAGLHQARTICRRAERLIVALSNKQEVEQTLLIYINRLADWLFVQARLANRIAGVEDVAWRK